jgi:hypothetical protein
MKRIRQGLSAAFLVAGTVFALPAANADVIYSVFGACNGDCTLTSPVGLVASLTVNEAYVAGQPLTSANFVSFTYGGASFQSNSVVPAFTLSSSLPFTLSGRLPPPPHLPLAPNGDPFFFQWEFPYGYEINFPNGCRSLPPVTPPLQLPCDSDLYFAVTRSFISDEAKWTLENDEPAIGGQPIAQGSVSEASVALVVVGTPVSEPTTLVLSGLALAAIRFVRRRKMNQPRVCH